MMAGALMCLLIIAAIDFLIAAPRVPRRQSSALL